MNARHRAAFLAPTLVALLLSAAPAVALPSSPRPTVARATVARPTVARASVGHAVSGNAAAIALARASAAIESRMGSLAEVETGYAFMRDELGKTSSMQWRYDVGRAPSGYVPVIEHLTFDFHEGRIIWLSDVMDPRCQATFCSDLPYQVLLTGGGLTGHFDVAGLPPAASCWSRLTGSVDGFSVGEDVLGASGHFAPVVRSGAIERITSVIRAGTGRTWTETESLSTATHLPIAEVVQSSAGAGIPAFSFAETNDRWFTGPHPEPRVTHCAL